jgi:pimeloyl-ACP methyl ester carboxylesterase
MCFSGLLLILSAAASADWVDNLNTRYRQLQKELRDAADLIKPKPKAHVREADASLLYRKIPNHWRVSFAAEPVFNSTIRIVQAGPVDRQTVVLIHGLGQNGFRDWLNVIPKLERDYHVLALDLPGFGQSSVPEGRYSPSNYAKVIEWLVSTHAKQPVVVVGHSMGGAVALRYSASYPDQVQQLVLVDAAGILERTGFIKHSAELPIDQERVPEVVKRITIQVKDFSSSIIELSTQIPDVTKVIDSNDYVWNKTFAGRPNLNAAMALINEDFSRAIKTLPHPTTIIWGRHDNVAPLRTGQMLAGRLNNASLQVIETSAHVPMSSNPEEFYLLLFRALKGISVAENVPAALTQQGDLHCKNASGSVYTGHYESIIIENCVGIKLKNVTADHAIINDSVVEFINTKLDAERTALTITESVLVATNSTFRGQLGIKTQGSRLDLAGVSVVGDKRSVEFGARSRIIFSVSDISSDAYRGDVHGVYQYTETNLDRILGGKNSD